MDRAGAIKHFEYGISHDIFKEPVTSYARIALAALREQENPTSSNKVSNEWISVKERLPEVEKRVLVSISRHSQYTGKDYVLVTCAIYEDGKVNTEDSCWMCEWGDYDKETDTTYVPKGWYEYHEYGNIEEDGVALIGSDPYLVEEVTHWMPLPEPPKAAVTTEKVYEQVQDAVDQHNREAMRKIAAFIEPKEGANHED